MSEKEYFFPDAQRSDITKAKMERLFLWGYEFTYDDERMGWLCKPAKTLQDKK